MEPNDLTNATKEQLVEAYAEACEKEEEIKAEKQVIKEELMSRMDTDAEIIGDYSVSKVKRVTFETSVEDARRFGAVKEAIDTQVLSKVFKAGQEVPGVKVTQYLLIKNVQQEKA